MNSGPVGIFDSGLGGLTVWREVRRQLPNEDIVYFADSRNCPYGRKSADEIVRLAHAIADRLLALGCKLIVVACNTATAAAIDHLRQSYPIPFVGMEPAIKQAALNTKTGRVGVLATKGTFDGRLYKQTSRKYANNIDVMVQIGDGLVELVERNEYESAEAQSLLHKYVGPMLEHGVDQIVLGCTHYPFYKPQIEAMAGSRATVIDPAPAVARRVGEVLAEHNLKNVADHNGTDLFLSSGSVEGMEALLAAMGRGNYSHGTHTIDGQSFESLLAM